MRYWVCFFRLPFTFQLVLVGYALKKLARVDMNGTHGEWVKVLYMALLKTGGQVVRLYRDSLEISLPYDVRIVARRYPSSDIKVLLQVFGNREYEPVLGIAQRVFSPQAVIRIMDAGANVGYTSLFFKSTFPNAQVLALEPADMNYDQILVHGRLNNLQDLIVLKAALWRSSARLAFRQVLKAGDEWAFSVEERSDGNVEGLSVDALMEKMHWDGIDILKMDIEGAEQYLFANKDSCRWLSKVHCIAMEIHPVRGLEARVHKLLQAYGFVFFRHGELLIAHR